MLARGSATGLKLKGPKRQNYKKSIVNFKNSLIFSKNWGGGHAPPPNSIGSGTPGVGPTKFLSMAHSMLYSIKVSLKEAKPYKEFLRLI